MGNCMQNKPIKCQTCQPHDARIVRGTVEPAGRVNKTRLETMDLRSSLPIRCLALLVVVTLHGLWHNVRGGQESIDRFGYGSNRFAIVFVHVGDPNNDPDPSSSFENSSFAPRPPADARLGAVSYEYRIGKYEVSNAMVDGATAQGHLLIANSNPNWPPPGNRGPNKPAALLAFYEILRFVNWLNVTTGHHPAYSFDDHGNWRLWEPHEAWQVGAENRYRHRRAYYFLPSADEWHKAGYYDPDAERFYKYPTGSDKLPTFVTSGTSPGTTVSWQPRDAGPADVDRAGGLSPYGTMAQAGNVMDWNESAFDATNDSVEELIHIRGDKWYFYPGASDFSDPWYPWGGESHANDCCGFRVAALPVICGDGDGDGVEDVNELIAGTDPCNGSDFLQLNVRREGDGVELSFHAVVAPRYGYMDPQRYYALEFSGDVLCNAWNLVDGCERIPSSEVRVTRRLPVAASGPQFYRLQVWLEGGLIPQPSRGSVSVDYFGEGTNAFAIEFVTIGDPGNADDPASGTVKVGGVGYLYRIGKMEVSEDMVNKANVVGDLRIALSAQGPRRPAGMMNFYERARFVNWLNTSQGYPPAYKFDEKGNWLLWPADEAWTLDGENLYRRKDTMYFLPSDDEWYKAARYNGERYRSYPTGSDYRPNPVPGGRIGGTAVFGQPAESGPADVDDAGGLSHYGTMAQGGNVAEWIETAGDGRNDLVGEPLQLRGGSWDSPLSGLAGVNSGGPSSGTTVKTGFRVAARVPVAK